jgi:hypothetical protein
MSTPTTDITQTDLANRGLSLIRTYAPIGVGYALTWLAAYGFGVDPVTQTALINGLAGLGGGIWFGLLRLVEPHLPKWVRLAVFWTAKMPTYASAEATAAPPRELVDPETGERVRAYLVTSLR